MKTESGCRDGEVRQSEDGSVRDWQYYLMEQEHDKRNHVKLGKDLEQEKPTVYQEYSDIDSCRDFERIKIDVLDGSRKLPPHSANGSRNDIEIAGVF